MRPPRYGSMSCASAMPAAQNRFRFPANHCQMAWSKTATKAAAGPWLSRYAAADSSFRRPRRQPVHGAVQIGDGERHEHGARGPSREGQLADAEGEPQAVLQDEDRSFRPEVHAVRAAPVHGGARPEPHAEAAEVHGGPEAERARDAARGQLRVNG